MKNRIDQINQLIKEEIGKIILREIEISKDAIITVIRVETSSDLRHSVIYVSVLHKENEGQALGELNRAIYDIQHTLNRTLRMRPVPKIRFEIDKSYETEQKLYEILANEKSSDSDAQNIAKTD